MQTDAVQTKREIEALLASAGLRPRKRFGQHFLIDGNLMRRLVASSGLTPGDLVLEVGAGTGGLTDLLAGRAARVLAVEIDRDLHGLLVERFKETPSVRPILGDILESKHTLMAEVARCIREHDGGAGGEIKLVANLPYQVATPVVMNLLVDYPQVRRLCFTVQAEVGERIIARPGRKAFGPLSIVAQTLCRVEVSARIPPQAFWPRPPVDSLMLLLEVGRSPFSGAEEARRFGSLVRRTFDHRRKTLRSALGYVLDAATNERVCDRIDVTRRPEQLSQSEWLDLFSLATS